jgi:iron complex transport system substrate-binding protein
MLPGCSSNKVSYPEGVETYIFTDDYGREVEVMKDITTIVGSGPNTQIILCTIAPDMLAGLNASPSTEQEKFYPPEFVDMPTLGQFYGSKASLNIENLIAVNPDIILDIGERKEDGSKDMDSIQSQTGIATVYLEATLDNYDEMYEKLGKLLGREEEAAELAEYCRKTSEYADKASAEIPDSDRKTIYFGVSTTGLNSNVNGSVQAGVIDKIGAVNAINIDDEINESDGGNPVNLEMVYAADPDIVVMGPDSPYDSLKEGSQWSELRAVKEDKYYEAPGAPYSWMSSPPSVNQVLGVRWLGKIVYPEVFTSDIYSDAREFYSLFYHYDLSDEELEEMLARSIGKVGQ